MVAQSWSESGGLVVLACKEPNFAKFLSMRGFGRISPLSPWFRKGRTCFLRCKPSAPLC